MGFVKEIRNRDGRSDEAKLERNSATVPKTQGQATIVNELEGEGSKISSDGDGMAASSTSSTGRCRKRVVLMRQPSREEEYEGPTRLCHHGFVAPWWTSWTEGNLGRRFYSCRNYYQDGGCGFFSWHDGEFGGRANEVIKDLLNDIDKLYDERRQLQRGKDVEKLYDELLSIHCDVRKLKASYGRAEMKFKVAMSY